jgi:hypothetical protein
MRPLAILLAFGVTLAAQAAFAQAPAGAKQRGEYGYYSGAGGSAIRSAQETSSYYRQYAQTAPDKKVNPEVAREAADAIGDYITKAQKHFAGMRKVAEAANDKETLTALNSIDKNLAAAKKSHDEMRETCLKDTVDGAATLECCKVIDDHLAKAIADHDKLMKRLGGTAGGKKK